MEKILEKLFDLKRIPTRLIFVIWISSGLVLFIPHNLLVRLKVDSFLQEHGKYIGVSFIISSAFLVVVVFSFCSNKYYKKRLKAQIEIKILKNITNLDFHEKALLREFCINGKNTIQLPIDNATVTGLVNKHIIYRASTIGFTYVHGSYFPFSITEFADNHLTDKMLDLPSTPTEEEKIEILNNRPQWAIDRDKFDNMFARW